MENNKRHLFTPIAGVIATALTPGQTVLAQSDDSEVFLEEVIVTATKRSVSVQDIPATVQALTAETLEAMGAKGMEDYSRFIPSMNVLTFGAGSNTVVFRGAITSQGFIAQSTSSVYLDEISVTTTGAQPSIRIVDIERVEALSGPQGTLYGSDAQAGTLRIITNKPEFDAFEAVVDLELRGGSKSDESYRGSVVFNMPMIEDTLAVRFVGFTDHDGGYIDNVFGHTPDSPAIPFSAPLTGATTYPAGFGTLDNSDSVEKRWNDADIKGGRIILSWNINDNWLTSFTALTQDTESGAQNDYDPFVGDLETVRFHKEYRDDDYQMYSFTVNGDLGFAQLVGAVNYYDREIEQVSDITAYAHYWAQRYCQDYTVYAAYYLPNYWQNPDSNYVVWWPVYCAGERVDSDFFSSYYSPAQQDKFTTEIRLSHQGERVDWIAGVYYEESNDSWQAPFATPTRGGKGDTNIYQNSASIQFWEWYYSRYYGTPTSYPEATSHWYSDQSTDWENKAIFGEFTWHINDAWDLTLGGRYFERESKSKFFVDHPGDIGLNGEPDNGDADIRAFRLETGEIPIRTKKEEEFIPKIALAWSFSEDQMVYGMYTQGIRPGGINRSRGEPFFPNDYDADLMDNYEMGYRSMFAGGNGRLNATFYRMEWGDYQLELVDPSGVTECDDPGESIAGVCGQPWQQIVTNAGDAHIMGLNVELDYAFNEAWRIGGNIEFIEAELDTGIDLDGDGVFDLLPGNRLPVSPEVKGSMWIDYSKPVNWFGGTELFSRFQASYNGSHLTTLEDRSPLDSPNPQFKSPSFTIADISLGVRGHDWEVSVFLNNLTDERAIFTINDGIMEWGMASVQDGRAHLQRNYVARPREFGLRYSKSWGG